MQLLVWATQTCTISGADKDGATYPFVSEHKIWKDFDVGRVWSHRCMVEMRQTISCLLEGGSMPRA